MQKSQVDRDTQVGKLSPWSPKWLYDQSYNSRDKINLSLSLFPVSDKSSINQSYENTEQ